MPSSRYPKLRAAALRTLLVLVSPTVIAQHGEAAADDPPSAPSFERCTIGDRQATLVAECATLRVPIDPLAPSGDGLSLAVARLPARDRGAAEDPLVFIAGGPGQSARDSFPAVASAFRHANRDRDILLVDQRGTGGSRPLDCPAPDDGASANAATDPVIEAAAAASLCLEALEDDTRLFTTSTAVADLERLRDALGIERWNLYGVSYGTRVALQYARRFPERTRALVLDAVVPPGTPLGPDIAPLAQRALDLILERCLDDTDCAEAFPGIDERTAAFIATLVARPRPVRWENIADGSVESVELDRSDIAVTLRLLAYSGLGASLLPSMLDDAIEHDQLAPFARQAELQARALSETLATGLHYSVICTEDLPFMDREAAYAAARDTFLGDTALKAQVAACERWPAGRIDADLHEPLDLAVPALLLSGEADPVTPPDYAERLLPQLGEGSRHLVNAGQGHMQAPLGCVPALMAAFLGRGSADELDTECLERLTPAPFFVDANGPAR